MGTVAGTTAELVSLVLKARRAGKSIVSTNGVFDILHVGHLRYLQKARNLGDVLIVGINSDGSTRELKGPLRPIICQSERAEMLAALNCVDLVYVFDESTPISFLEVVKPDIHVKGGDYNPDSLPETPTVQQFGGRCVALPFTEDRSTSDIIARITSAIAS